MSILDLRHLRTVAALRDGGSLVEAADKIFLTQSALSHQIKDLEEKLGCSLFLRKILSIASKDICPACSMALK